MSGRPSTLLQIILFLGFLSAPLAALPHPGGLDKDGGHTETKTGLYHCHSDSCFSLYGDTVGQIGEDDEGASFVLLYDRDDWPHWIDEDGDCQDTRAEVLIRDSLVPVTFADERQCDVREGLWRDAYTGMMYSEASELEIDHVVSLKWAHGHGGDRWERSRKRVFANDLRGLVAASARVNQQKGSRGPDDWLPSKPYRCEYLGKFLAVTQEYGLKMVEVELSANSNQHECRIGGASDKLGSD